MSGRLGVDLTLRATFWDVDGTLMSGRTFYHGAINLIRDIASTGAMIALCSARPVASMEDIARELGVVDYIAAFQGAVILRRKEGSWETIAEQTIDPMVLSFVMSAITGSTCELWVYDSTDWYTTAWSEFTRREADVVGLTPISLNGLSGGSVIRKILIVDRSLDASTETLIRSAAHRFELNVNRSSPIYLEMSPGGGGNDKGLRQICTHSNFDPCGAVAIGNDENDRGMLLGAGFSYALPPLSSFLPDSSGIMKLNETGDAAIATLRSLLLTG